MKNYSIILVVMCCYNLKAMDNEALSRELVHIRHDLEAVSDELVIAKQSEGNIRIQRNEIQASCQQAADLRQWLLEHTKDSCEAAKKQLIEEKQTFEQELWREIDQRKDWLVFLVHACRGKIEQQKELRERSAALSIQSLNELLEGLPGARRTNEDHAVAQFNRVQEKVDALADSVRAEDEKCVSVIKSHLSTKDSLVSDINVESVSMRTDSDAFAEKIENEAHERNRDDCAPIG